MAEDERRKQKPWLIRRGWSSGQIKSFAALSSSLLPAFGAGVDGNYPDIKKYVIAPYDPRYRSRRPLFLSLSLISLSFRFLPCSSSSVEPVLDSLGQVVADVSDRAGVLLSMGVAVGAGVSTGELGLAPRRRPRRRRVLRRRHRRLLLRRLLQQLHVPPRRRPEKDSKEVQLRAHRI